MQCFVHFNRRVRPFVFDLDAVPLFDFFTQLQRFFELVARVEIEHVHPRLDLRDHVNDRAAFRAERRGHGELGEVMLDGPAHNFLRRGRFQLLAFGFQETPAIPAWPTTVGRPVGRVGSHRPPADSRPAPPE